LTDDDRWPWLDAIVAAMHERAARRSGAVIACSALKEAYRERLRRGGSAVGEVRIVYLKGDAATIASRLTSRKGHYMPASLLDSQFAALEEPGDAIVVDIRQSTKDQARQAAAALRSTSDSAA
jgi:gluconokinase